MCTTAFALAAVLASACAADEAILEARLPSTSTPARVELLGVRGDYRDVAVETGGASLRFFLPVGAPPLGAPPAGADACAAVLEPGADVRYVHDGLLGRLDAGDARCEIVGVLSLETWRDRRPRGSREPVPRSRATFRVVYRDDDVSLARGRFGLAGELGWVGGADTVAAFARSERCDRVLAQGVASLEYRHEGPDVLALVASDGLCPLLGIARPLRAP
ncbi:MAG: hypothetical protein R3E88_05280 [Myxococcota bacterium]